MKIPRSYLFAFRAFGYQILVKAPWNKPLFSEREGWRKPSFRLLGWRVFFGRVFDPTSTLLGRPRPLDHPMCRCALDDSLIAYWKPNPDSELFTEQDKKMLQEMTKACEPLKQA